MLLRTAGTQDIKNYFISLQNNLTMLLEISKILRSGKLPCGKSPQHLLNRTPCGIQESVGKISLLLPGIKF